MTTHDVSFDASFSITVEKRHGWYYGRSNFGVEANSDTEMDCVRKIKDSVFGLLKNAAKVRKK